MATAAKFVQPIPIFLAYLVPLDVDVVPVKFHQFLFVPTMFHEVWIDERNQKSFKIPLLFHWQLRQRLSYWFWFFWGYLVPLDVDVTGYITAKIYEVWSEFNILCTLVTMATAAILNLFNPPKAATHYGGYSYKVSWSLMKGIKKSFKSPLFCFRGNCGNNCPTDSDFFGLARSTRCWCCSYQVSSISVRRVTCYDRFCAFQFFSIFAVSMATAAILKKLTLISTTSHGIWYSYKVS
jgi:hypothetical protein